jgi:hypothetical protein
VFYIRKLTKVEPVCLIRKATPVELHNYKNRFIVKPPIAEPDQETSSGCECGCRHNIDELLFVNINCDLDLDNLSTKE